MQITTYVHFNQITKHYTNTSCTIIFTAELFIMQSVCVCVCTVVLSSNEYIMQTHE